MTASPVAQTRERSAVPALELHGIDRRCGITQANDKVDLVVQRATVHAIVGENGAGKSTLMKIAYGLMRADAGTIRIGGEEIARTRHRPTEALARGVGMVHQHFMLVGSLTVAENLILGHEPTRSWWGAARRAGAARKGHGVLDLARANHEIAALAERFGLDVDPRRRTDELSVGEQQRVEILRILWLGAQVLILDEPTAVLTPGEVKRLFTLLRTLVAEGKTVVLVTHKLDEVHAIADRVTVLRKGKVVAELPGDAPPEDIARAMVGRPVLLEVHKPPAHPGDVVLAVAGLRVAGRTKEALSDVSFEVRAGEILGFAGVEGNGQSELVEALAGLRAVTSGAIRFDGKDVLHASVAARQEAGLGLVPEDRQARGLALELSIADNLHLGRLAEVSRPLRLDRKAMQDRARQSVADYAVTPTDPEAIVATLSGGNQQKLVLARELGRPGLRCLVCAQPTRGVDIGAIELIYQRLLAARAAGVAIVLISAELNELRALADRVAVLHRGRIVEVVAGEALADPAELERIGGLMTGARA